MKLPFTTDQFLGIFTQYNQALHPWQGAVYLLVLAALLLILWHKQAGTRMMLILLPIMWLINGIAYHILFFSRINAVARVFGGMFVLQALLLLPYALKRDLQPVRPFGSVRSVVGWILVFYGIFVYGLIGHAIGHQYPTAPVFGVAPCPTVIFTLGMMLILAGQLKKHLFIIPVLWSAIGASAAFKLGIKEDIGLLVSGLAALGMILLPAGNRQRVQAD